MFEMYVEFCLACTACDSQLLVKCHCHGNKWHVFFCHQNTFSYMHILIFIYSFEVLFLCLRPVKYTRLYFCRLTNKKKKNRLGRLSDVEEVFEILLPFYVLTNTWML